MKQKELDWIKNFFIKMFFKVLFIGVGFVFGILILLVIINKIISIGGTLSIILFILFFVILTAGIITFVEYTMKKDFNEF
jgi:hypothetical protein